MLSVTNAEVAGYVAHCKAVRRTFAPSGPFAPADIPLALTNAELRARSRGDKCFLWSHKIYVQNFSVVQRVLDALIDELGLGVGHVDMLRSTYVPPTVTPNGVCIKGRQFVTDNPDWWVSAWHIVNAPHCDDATALQGEVAKVTEWILLNREAFTPESPTGL